MGDTLADDCPRSRVIDAVVADEIIEIFHDVPKWEQTSDGAMRIQMPEIASSGEAVAAVHITEQGPNT